MRPFRHRLGQVEAGDHAIAASRIRHRHEDRVLLEQRVAGEVHLRHQPLQELVAEEREMDVAGTPRVEVVAPRVGSRLDRHEAVAALVVRDAAADPVEVGIERRRMVVHLVAVAPAGVGLPHLDERVAHRSSAGVQHAPVHDDALALRLPCPARGEVRVAGSHAVRAQRRARELGRGRAAAAPWACAARASAWRRTRGTDTAGRDRPRPGRRDPWRSSSRAHPDTGCAGSEPAVPCDRWRPRHSSASAT